MSNRLNQICLTLMLVVLMPMQALAQEAVPVTVSGQVTIHNKENGKDIHERVEYTMLTKAEALIRCSRRRRPWRPRLPSTS